MLTLERAKELLNTTTAEEHLFLHATNVMAAMGGLAKHFGEDESYWMAIGYLHDYDYFAFNYPTHYVYNENADFQGIDDYFGHLE